MRLRGLLLAILPLLLLVAAACGDETSTVTSAQRIASQSPAAQSAVTPTPSPTLDPNGLGPEPALGGNITSIVPKHGAQVKQINTRTSDPRTPHGICAAVTFDGLPENAQWFRIAYDDKEVTATKDVTWIVTSTANPTDGTVCYAPEAGFTVGRHSVAIAVQDPRNPQSTTRQIVAWKFDVIP